MKSMYGFARPVSTYVEYIITFGDCSRDPGFDMDRAGDHFYTTGPTFFPEETAMFGPDE
jgi:hypothetical protein